MAHQLNEFKAQIDRLVSDGMEQEEALYKVLKETIIASQNIRFEAMVIQMNGKDEAARRGLTNILPCARSHHENSTTRNHVRY